MRGINHADDFGWANTPRFGGSSVPSTTTSNTTTQPWSGQIPYLTGEASPGPGQPPVPGVFPAAQSLYQNQAGWPQYYPNNTYAGLTPAQNGFIGGAETYGANMGNSGINAANSSLTSMLSPGYTAGTQPGMDATNRYLTSTINGANLDPFSAPGFQNVINGTLANVIPATSASFIGGGRADSGLAQAAQTAAATNAIGSLANQNYLAEQGLQQGAAAQAANNALTQQGNQIKGAALAPGIDQAQLGDINAGLSAAGMQQSDVQNQINALMSRWNYNQALPFNMLGQYQNYVGGTGYGGTTTGQQTTPYYSNTASNLLGAGAGAAGILGATGAFGGSGWLTSLLGLAAL